MLKGDVFKWQYFPVESFAAFIDTFLNQESGIKNGYLNSMEVTSADNSVTINSGLACVRGRFFREDSYTTIDVTSESTFFAKLVIEIDLSKENTLDELKQLQYKIVKAEANYPALTQDDIVNNESGVYQYELARFKIGPNGVTDFQDMRTYLDFNSIYAKIEEEIIKIEDGSIFVTKNEYQPQPIGSGMDFYGSTAPDNYMFADGKEISRTEYSELFKVIGTTYGAGNGKTTFNLPDKRSRVSVMMNATDSNFNTLGKKVGAPTHTLTEQELAPHKHTINDPGHSHDVEYGSGSGTPMYDKPAKTSFLSDGFKTFKTLVAKTGITINNSGSGKAFNIIQPSLVCNYIIRVK